MTRMLIAGGGIAGLTTALALHHVGYRDITVLERSQSLQPLGSGINLMPQAGRELDGLGILSDLRSIAVETSELIYTTADGEEIWREPRGTAAGFRWPQLSIHRGWLQMRLAHHVRARLGETSIRTGTEVVAAAARSSSEPGICVQYRDRDSMREQHTTADLLIGADGIRSAVRRIVAPADPGPRPISQIVWRGMAKQPSFLDGRTMVIAGNQGHRVVFYPISRTSDTALLNWAAAGPLNIDAGAEEGDWNLPAHPESFASRFDGWRIHGVDVAALMRASEDCFAYPMVDLDPLDSWTKGNITLIGDAAHAMYPVGSNGATQSIVDAAALAYHLATSTNSDAGLLAYEQDRRPKTRSIQESNRKMGPEVVIDLAAARVPQLFGTVAEAFRPGELEAIASRYARTTALDEANADSRYHTFNASESTRTERNPT